MASPLLRSSLPALRTVSSLALVLIAIAAQPARGGDPAAPDRFSGTYDVRGTTVDTKSGDTRRLDGHIVLTRKNGRYCRGSGTRLQYDVLPCTFVQFSVLLKSHLRRSAAAA